MRKAIGIQMRPRIVSLGTILRLGRCLGSIESRYTWEMRSRE